MEFGGVGRNREYRKELGGVWFSRRSWVESGGVVGSRVESGGVGFSRKESGGLGWSREDSVGVGRSWV